MDPNFSKKKPNTLRERLWPYAFASAFVLLLLAVLNIVAKGALLTLGASSETVGVIEVFAKALLVVIGGWLLVGIWLFRRSDGEEKRIQALLEQKTAALLSAPPESKEALSLAAEVDAIMCYSHLNQMSDSSVKDYLRVQDNIYDDIRSERMWFGPLYSEWLGKKGGRESFCCLQSYRTSFSSHNEYKSQTTKTLRAFGIPKMLCSTDVALRWLFFPLYVIYWFTPQKGAEAAFDDEGASFVTEYVDGLLQKYIACHHEDVPSLTLSQSQPSGLFGTDRDNKDLARAGMFFQISNRLKVLAGLNPVCYQEPVEATLTVAVQDGATGEPRNEKLRLFFDDRCDDPFCRIEMDQTSSPASATPV